MVSVGPRDASIYASLDILEAFLLVAHAGLDVVVHVLMTHIVSIDLFVCDGHYSEISAERGLSIKTWFWQAF